MRKFRNAIISLLLVIIAAVCIAPGAKASIVPGGGRNQLSTGLPFRLDLHTGEGASNESGPFRLYWDSGCTQEAPAWRYRGSQAWAVLWPETNNGYSTMITVPILTVDSSGTDSGLHYTTYWGKNSDLQYIISGTGHFNGSDWDENAWWNHLPSNITYTSVHPGNGENIFVGNNIDGFQVIGPDSDGNSILTTGDFSCKVMYGALSTYCYYDASEADAVNAVYQWQEASHPWTTENMHEGINTVYFAGMDWSGNYMTGQRSIKWDTMAPLMQTDLGSVAHNGWLNASVFNSSDVYTISSNDDQSVTKDVSGLNPFSLGTVFDGINRFGDGNGFQAFTYYVNNKWNKQLSYRNTMEALGVQSDGTGGQGVHSYHFYDQDNAGNWGSSDGSVKIDTVPPTCTPSQPKSDWHTGYKPITLTFSDITSGVAVQQYSWSQSQTDAGTWQDYTAGQQLDPPGDGQWYLHWQATDVAGNASSGVLGPYSKVVELDVKIQTPNASYFIGSDVITSVKVTDNSATPVLPGDNAVLTFTIKNPDGSHYSTLTKNVICPDFETNLIWFKWHAPQAAGAYSITASVTAANTTPQPTWTDNLSWQVSTLFENTPPNPQATDRFTDYTIPSVPTRSSLPNVSWNEWSYGGGSFTKNTYTASLSASLTVSPGPNTPTAILSAGVWTMKSGYGLTEKEAVSTASDQPAAVTAVQSVTSFYPEFDYETYNRNLEQTSAGVFELPANIYSIFQSRVHFTPVDFPDGTYTVQSYAYNTWTPAGMISAYSTGSIHIQGAVFDDWYTHPGN